MWIFSGVETLFFPPWPSVGLLLFCFDFRCSFVLGWESLPLNFYSLLSTPLVHSVQSWIVSLRKAFFFEALRSLLFIKPF